MGKKWKQEKTVRIPHWTRAFLGRSDMVWGWCLSHITSSDAGRWFVTTALQSLLSVCQLALVLLWCKCGTAWGNEGITLVGFCNKAACSLKPQFNILLTSSIWGVTLILECFKGSEVLTMPVLFWSWFPCVQSWNSIFSSSPCMYSFSFCCSTLFLCACFLLNVTDLSMDLEDVLASSF